MKHTPECFRKRQMAIVAQSTYSTLWPGHCSNCDGWGYFQEIDPVGDTSSPFDLSLEDCPVCVGKGECPRCGARGQAMRYYDDTFMDPPTCYACGFDRYVHDGMQKVHDCYCVGL